MFFRLTRSVSREISTLLPGIQYNDTPYEQKYLAPCHTFVPLTALGIVPAEQVVCSTMRCGHSARMLDAIHHYGQFQMYTLFLSRTKPTVSPLIIPLLYCHINGFQGASSVEKPLLGGENRMDG